MENDRYNKPLLVLIIISTLVRIIISSITELGNDEVYYWTYALYPALSYFDHPPLIGLLIRITTLNLAINNEIFVRLGSIIFGILNTIIIFKTGKLLKDSKTGFYASMLYTASLYGTIIIGIFILPDTPQSFFWILSVYFLLKSIVNNPDTAGSKKYILLSGVTIGLGMLAKYHAAFLWLGAALYIIIYNRRWLLQKEFYLSILITSLLFLPVVIWNIGNDFISLSFHSGRVSIFSTDLKPEFLFREIAGQVFYNNPVNFILIITALIFLFRNKVEISSAYKRLLLLTGLPIIILFIFFSLTRQTLPHWSAPGYFSLILITAIWITSNNLKKIVTAAIYASFTFIAAVLVIGLLIVNFGIINLSPGGKNIPGSHDVSLEMFGWKQIRAGFQKFSMKYSTEGEMSETAPIVSNKWNDAAHIEYYAAYPSGRKVISSGSAVDTRNYYLLNRYLNAKLDCYYITTSNYFYDPEKIYNGKFEQIKGPDTIAVFRGGEITEYAYLYRIYGFDPGK